MDSELLPEPRTRPRSEVASMQEAQIELPQEIIPLKQKKTENLWAMTYLFSFSLILLFVLISYT